MCECGLTFHTRTYISSHRVCVCTESVSSWKGPKATLNVGFQPSKFSKLTWRPFERPDHPTGKIDITSTAF